MNSEVKAENTAVYCEDDWKALVEIEEDISDYEYESYRLKVIRTVLESRIYKPTPDGTVFEVSWRHNVGMKDWYLFRKGDPYYERWVKK